MVYGIYFECDNETYNIENPFEPIVGTPALSVSDFLLLCEIKPIRGMI